jgi:pantothenate kinase-related protein Tda10
VGEIIVQADGRPISIGVAGAWGVGKSSMIRLVQRSLEKRHKEGADRDFVFVEFNAWLYQGYDDARAALMEVIGDTLLKEAKKRYRIRKGPGIHQASSMVSCCEISGHFMGCYSPWHSPSGPARRGRSSWIAFS